MSRSLRFHTLKESSTNDKAPLDNDFDSKFTSSNVERYSGDKHFQTREERANAQFESYHGQRNARPRYLVYTNTRKNAKETHNMRDNIGGRKRKSRGKRTKKGKKTNKKSANKKRSVKKGKKIKKSKTSKT
jgi:hypothetical protein